MEPFFAVVRVMLTQPVSESAAEPPLVGYYRQVGVAADAKANAMREIERIVSDGKVDWPKTEWLPFRELENRTACQYDPLGSIGCWYLSGRVFFPA